VLMSIAMIGLHYGAICHRHDTAKICLEFLSVTNYTDLFLFPPRFLPGLELLCVASTYSFKRSIHKAVVTFRLPDSLVSNAALESFYMRGLLNAVFTAPPVSTLP